MPRPADTRKELIAAGETLLAERGVSGVSLREIARAAQQRNASALQYHFGGRAGLVEAILAKHTPDIEARLGALLDLYESRGGGDLHDLAEALVRPLAAKLADPAGRRYLKVVAQLLHAPDPIAAIPARLLGRAVNLNRWLRLVEPFIPAAAHPAQQRRLVAIRFVFSELARRAATVQRRRQSQRTVDELSVSQLADLVVALLEAPVSETAGRAEEARVGRGRRASAAPRRRAGGSAK